jgi:hypothetical protein
MCPINLAKRRESSSNLEKESKENAGFRKKFVLVNLHDVFAVPSLKRNV